MEGEKLLDRKVYGIENMMDIYFTCKLAEPSWITVVPGFNDESRSEPLILNTSVETNSVPLNYSSAVSSRVRFKRTNATPPLEYKKKDEPVNETHNENALNTDKSDNTHIYRGRKPVTDNISDETFNKIFNELSLNSQEPIVTPSSPEANHIPVSEIYPTNIIYCEKINTQPIIFTEQSDPINNITNQPDTTNSFILLPQRISPTGSVTYSDPRLSPPGKPSIDTSSPSINTEVKLEYIQYQNVTVQNNLDGMSHKPNNEASVVYEHKPEFKINNNESALPKNKSVRKSQTRIDDEASKLSIREDKKPCPSKEKNKSNIVKSSEHVKNQKSKKSTVNYDSNRFDSRVLDESSEKIVGSSTSHLPPVTSHIQSNNVSYVDCQNICNQLNDKNYPTLNNNSENIELRKSSKNGENPKLIKTKPKTKDNGRWAIPENPLNSQNFEDIEKDQRAQEDRINRKSKIDAKMNASKLPTQKSEKPATWNLVESSPVNLEAIMEEERHSIKCSNSSSKPLSMPTGVKKNVPPQVHQEYCKPVSTVNKLTMKKPDTFWTIAAEASKPKSNL